MARMAPSSTYRSAAVMATVLVLGACGLRTSLTDSDTDRVVRCPVGGHDCYGSCVPNASVSSCGTSCVACPETPGYLATCDGTSCGHTCASGCLDEMSDWCAAGNDLTADLNEGVRFVGQVYTAGHTGTLSGVNIDVAPISASRFDLRVAIRQAAGGLPTQVVLGATTLATSDSPFDSLVQFSPPIQQVTGQQYAIVVDYPDDPSIGDWQGEWEGTMSINCYAGGNQVGSVDGINWGSADGTLHFRVFIKTK